MSYDITSWDENTYASVSIPKIIENFRALKEDGIVSPEIATLLEAQAGTDATKAITAYILAQLLSGLNGGTAGQALTKNSDTNKDFVWATIHQVPSGGTTGQFLGKSSNSDYALTWVDAPTVADQNFFVADANGDIMPGENPTNSDFYEIDTNGDIMPVEG